MDMSVYPPPLYRLFPFIDVKNIIGVRYVSIIHLFEICRSHRNSCTLNLIFGEGMLRHFKRQYVLYSQQTGAGQYPRRGTVSLNNA